MPFSFARQPSLAEMMAGAVQAELPPPLPPSSLPRSYGEGAVMAPQQWWNSALGGPLQQLGPQREERLQFDRREALGIPNPDTPDPWAQAMPEGGVWSSRPPGVSPFADPLNQPLRRPPFGLY